MKLWAVSDLYITHEANRALVGKLRAVGVRTPEDDEYLRFGPLGVSARLDRIAGPTVLINHWPLVIEPTQRLGHLEIALWSGTTQTRTWPERYRAQAVIHGHLHISVKTVVAGIPHVEVSLGYPFERARYAERPILWPYLVAEY